MSPRYTLRVPEPGTPLYVTVAGHVIARDVVEPEASRLRRDAVNAEEHLWMRCQDALYGTPHNRDDAHHEIEPGAGR
jgi:hypothetical protein